MQIAPRSGWGERLLPYFLMAMATCWINALLIAGLSLNLFQTHMTLLPLWAPFVFMAGSYWLTMFLERHALPATSQVAGTPEQRRMGTGWIFTFIAVATLFVVWASVYTPTAAFFDLRWPAALLNDILLLDATAFHVALILALTVYFCWRGIRISRRVIEPADVFKGLRTGGIAFLIVILIRMLVGPALFNEFLIALLIPLFLAFALVTHALAQALFIRRSHTVGLQGSAAAQERSLLMISSGVGLLLLAVALMVSAFASPSILAQLQQALSPLGVVYDLLVNWLAYAVVFLLTPLFWLLSLLHLHSQLPTIHQRQPLGKPGVHQPSPPPALVVASIPFIKVLLPLVLVVVAVIAIFVALRLRRVLSVQRNEEQHESLWSWQLFWTQVRAFFLAVWRRFFPSHATEDRQQESLEVLATEPAARAIREIYRAFLRWSASRGYQRKKDETPYELQTRLDAAMPTLEAEVAVVTDAYTVTRYGDVLLDAAEVQRVQQAWAALQQKVHVDP